MWRAFFLGAGLFLMVLGLECLIIDQATVMTVSEGGGANLTTFQPPDWVPWSLISAGAVTILYSYTLPKKFTT